MSTVGEKGNQHVLKHGEEKERNDEGATEDRKKGR